MAGAVTSVQSMATSVLSLDHDRLRLTRRTAFDRGLTHLYHPPKNTLSFQRITPHPPSEWHYIRVMARSDGVFSDPSRRGIDRQRVVNLA